MLGELKTPGEEWIARFFRRALETAGWSKDPVRKVGAVVVSPDRRQTSDGYNGFPRGMLDLKQRMTDRAEKNRRTIHAELNAILNARFPLDGCSLFATRCPCRECAKAIVQAGIVAVYAPPPDEGSNWYDSHKDAVDYLTECGVTFYPVQFKQEGQ